MKVKILTDIIRKVVNEEVKKVVRTEIRKVLSEGNTSRPISKKSNKVQYTKNKSLNDILNETAGGIPQDSTMASMEQNMEQQMEEYPTIAKAMTRNYGDLMKAIDKKRGK